VEFEWKIPKWSNAIERDRARTYFQAYAAAAALYFAEQALAELHAGRTKTWNDFKVPEEGLGCGFHEAVRGVLAHHVVIRNHKIANYHPYPPTPWNDIEALLVNRVGYAHDLSRAEYYIAPIDECYRLVGLIRANWKGLSGGSEVWSEIGRFFSGLRSMADIIDGEQMPAPDG
jgi:Ni,Fe-hydrogenase III large subunit